MSKLYFKIGADYDKVIRLRDEIAKLKQELLSMNQAINPQAFSRLEVQLRQTTQEFGRLVRQAAIAGAQLQTTTININHLNNGFGNLNSMLAKVGGAAALTKLASDIIRVRGEFQQLEIAFETMLGSKEKATTLMIQLTETAAKTPFDLQSISQGAKQLLAYGTASEEVNETLVRLGNIASGLSIPLGDMVYLYGTTQTQGRLFTQDVRQFMGRGIPLVKELAAELGKTEQEVNEMVTAGKVGFPEVERVIRNMTSEGGQFYNLMESQSASLTGQISNLGDAWDSMLNEIGTQTQGVASAGISAVSSLVENYETVGKILTGLIVTYGVYKAALIANIALTHSWAVAARVDAVAKGIQTIATKAQTIAQLALNSAMKANPYVLAATLVVGVASAMWALHDSTSAAERAQGKFNDELDKFKQKEEERKQKIGGLIRTIQDETETELGKVRAYEELQRLSPGLTDAYTREKLAVASLADTNKELNKVRDVESYDNIIANIDKYSRYVKELQSISGGWSSSTKSTSHLQMEYPNTNVSNARELAIEDLKKWQEVLDEYKRLKKEAEENSKPVEVKLLEAKNNREQILQEFLSAKMTLEEEQQKIKDSGCGEIPIWVQIRFDNAKKALSNIDGIIKGLLSGQKNDVTYKEAYDTAKKEWKAAQKALKESKKKSKDDYEKAKKDLDEKEKTFKGLGGDTNTTKQENKAQKEAEKLRKDQEKYNLLLDKQKLDQARSAENLQIQVDQARINAMDEGSKKTLEQMELNFEKEMQAIDRQKEDLLRKKIEDERAAFESDPKNKKKTFDPTGIVLSDGENKQFDSLYKAQIESFRKDKWKLELESMRDYLKEYGTFQQQKLAITEEYADKIKNAQYKGEVLKLEKERDTTIQNKETEAIKANIDWVTVFGEFGGMFNNMIKPALEEAKKYVQTDKFKDSDQASQKELINAINQMEKSLGGVGGVSFKKLGQEMKTYQNSLSSLDTAKNEEIDAINQLKKAQEEYEKAMKDGTEQEKQLALDARDAAQENVDAASSNVKTLTDIANQNKENVTKTATGLQAAMDNVTGGLNKLASGGIKSAYDGLIQAGKGIGGSMEKITKNLENVPILGWIVAIIDVFKDGLSNFIGPLLDAIFNAISGIISDVLSGDFFVTIAESISKGIVNIVKSIVTLGGTFSFMDDESDPDLQADIDKLTASNERLEDALNRLADKMDEAATSDATSVFKEQLDNVKSREKNTQEMMQREGAAWARFGYGFAGLGGKGSSDSKINDSISSSEWKEISKVVGRNISSAGDFWGLSSEEMAKVADQAGGIYDKIKGYADDGHKDAAKYMDDYISYAKEREELEKAYYEKLTNTSFDSVRNEFKNVLLDMESDVEDFTNNFEKMMQNAIIESMMTEKYDKKLKDWYRSFGDAMEDGEMTQDEKNALKTDYNNMVDDALKERDVLKDMIGLSSSSSSQSSTQKSFEAMSQDSADELNGRFTALQIAGEEIKNQNIFQSQSLNLLTMKADSIISVNTEVKNIADEIRTIQINSYLELQEIRENTGAIVKPIQQMQKDIEAIKDNTKNM